MTHKTDRHGSPVAIRFIDITVSETGSFPLYNCDVWGPGNVISPELFYFFSVESGKEISWSRTYEFKG